MFEDLDLDTVDWRFSIRGEREALAGFAVVGIDDVTFSDLDVYPLPRSVHGRVMRRLKAYGARLIAYDIQFSEPSEKAAEDNVFMDAARAAGDVVFATTEVDDRGAGAFLGEAEGIRQAQGMTKGTPHSVFIADSTRELLQRALDDLIFVDEVEVRGRQAKVKLWSLPEGAKS